MTKKFPSFIYVKWQEPETVEAYLVTADPPTDLSSLSEGGITNVAKYQIVEEMEIKDVIQFRIKKKGQKNWEGLE